MRHRLSRAAGRSVPALVIGLLLFVSIATACAEVRMAAPLSVDRANGADISYGEIATYREVPKQNVKRHIVLEAERYDTVAWQEARIKNLVSEQWLDEVEGRLARKSFKHEGAAEGACVKLADALSYPFYCSEPGRYYLWLRYWKPKKGGWSHELQVNDETIRVKLDDDAEPKQWFWQKVGRFDLKLGNNTLYIRYLRNGKMLDKMVFHRRPSFKPKDDYTGPKVTPVGKIEEATVDFASLRPAGVARWQRIDVPRHNAAGKVVVQYAWDDNERWRTVGPDGAVAQPEGDTPEAIRVRMRLSAAADGVPPRLGMPRVVFQAPDEAYPTLEGENVRYTFSRRTGAISGIEVLDGETVHTLMAPGTDREPFRLRVRENMTPPLDGTWRGADAFALTKSTVSKDEAAFFYKGRELPIEFVLRYRLDPTGVLLCDAEVTNRFEQDVTGLEFARLTQVNIGSDASDDRLIWPIGTGKYYDNPLAIGSLSIGVPLAGVAFCDMFDGAAGLYYAHQDPDMMAGEMRTQSDPTSTTMSFQQQKFDRVKPGETKTYHVAVGGHLGDWHAGADWYGPWFRKTFGVADWPEWTKESHGWHTGNISYDIRHYDDLVHYVYRPAIRNGLSHVQMWGSQYPQGSGGRYYYPPHYLGGPEAFARSNKWWRDRGGVMGIYMFPNGISSWVMWPEHKAYYGVPWEEIPEWGRPPEWENGASWDWVERNASWGSDLKKPAPPTEKWKKHRTWWQEKGKRRHSEIPGIPPAHTTAYCLTLAEEWMEWYKTWVADIYVTKLHTGASYNDTMHYGGNWPQYNPRLDLYGEGNGGMRRHEWCREIRDLARKNNPMYLPVMEMQCDLYGMYFAYMIGRSSIDTELLYYTHPDHMAFEGQVGAGQYTMQTMLKRTASAWLYGSRMDFMVRGEWYRAALEMRKWMVRWINEGRFMDDRGLTVNNPQVKAKYRRLMHENGSRGFFVTTWHTGRHDYHPENYTLRGQTHRPIRLTFDLGPMASVDDTGTTPADWIPKRAILIDYNKPPREIPFQVVWTEGRPYVECTMPSRWIGGVLFVTEARGEHATVATIDQEHFERINVHIMNPGDEPITGAVTLRCRTAEFERPRQSFTAKPGERIAVSFPYADGRPPVLTELVEADIEVQGTTRTLRGAAYPPLDDPSFELLGAKLHKETFTDAMASDGKWSKVGGRYDIYAEPSTKYRLTMKMRAKKGKSSVRMTANRDGRTQRRLDGIQLMFERKERIPSDEWKTVAITFETPELYFKTDLGVFAPRDNPVYVDDVKLERLPADAKVDYTPEFHPFPKGHSLAKEND